MPEEQAAAAGGHNSCIFILPFFSFFFLTPLRDQNPNLEVPDLDHVRMTDLSRLEMDKTTNNIDGFPSPQTNPNDGVNRPLHPLH